MIYIQYVIVFALIVFAIYYLGKKLLLPFFKNKKSDCSKGNCGCSRKE